MNASHGIDTALQQPPLPEPLWRGAPPAPPTAVAVIESLATGSPSGAFDQAASAERVASRFDDPAQAERIRRVYAKTMIDTRHLAIDPLDEDFAAFSARPDTVRERMDLFAEHAAPLAIDTARRALGTVDPADVGQLVFVTSTGFLAPGVDVAVVRALGLPASTSRVVVNFMGCAAAMNALRVASDYVRAHPDRKSLMVCLELSSVNAVFAGDPNDVVISSLFADGCGAAVIGASEVGHPLPAGSIVVRDTFAHLLDDAEDGIVLGVNANGITCELAQSLPRYIIDGVAPVVDGVLQRNGLDRDAIAHWAIHPGGPKIIESASAALGLPRAASETSWAVLAEHGNMLSVSLLFVLERLLAARTAGAEPQTGIAFSFAPGVTVEGFLFDVIGGE
ncbi:type III polyketide synthase [Tsukamurella strandjordii]|uniref:3-oxoacyl-[acyl-carrier-protein] synthase III C-terminal domain-containing protein n=1 Tax=Tsukamurella strandjordii TaxID=147577 RepID=A0AA90N7U0_9ACTN|nr:3-oxoacyl-[acyl-carrier-protein] synthase III C-terminal domain-containing protein [Tsukamurella strandjordii]MDP0397202.1 3-oxoacyl-[acyl-carrier-protein] synthase III C-terminal domain-containing protein [Tsukamurella strandjordii]